MVSFGWGYFLADLQKAMSLTVAPDAEAIFLAGYQELRPLPPGFDEYYELFTEARQVAVHWC